MLADRIRSILRANPHWGAQTVAKAAGTTHRVVRATASREGIAFMRREDVEAYADELRVRLEAAHGAQE